MEVKTSIILKSNQVAYFKEATEKVVFEKIFTSIRTRRDMLQGF